ncbi:ATP-binding protein [Aeromicrobium sp. YIM 150415]|uniref:ATP-binding protein n=1 Tax=Aeromicrobium sp. YIM 150415 TaxID=2803912 RepID=UPI001964A67D|nr:ATP-binding protein [Aeromicrobium sp. YIM 150415]MBM9464213.1 ATP-binding protein [Aeromicrobium sp. YIM 150415]
MANPFTPTFGVSPPVLVGRDEVIEDFGDALDSGPGDPARAMLFTGARGAGKTVMLNALEDQARRRNWVVVSETTRPGVAEEIARSTLPRLLAKHAGGSTEWRATSAELKVSGTGLGISREFTERYPATATFRSQLEDLADHLAPIGSGVVISLDEVHTAARDDLRAITQAVQHAFRDGRQVAFVGAGLPGSVDDVLSDEVMTFMRRAERYGMTSVSPGDVRRALREPVEMAGRTIGDEALTIAADGTQGYPFLVQLIGFRMWAATPDSDEISPEDADKAVGGAIRRVGQLVHEPALAPLSPITRSFLLAMAQDDGPSKMADIARRLGVDANYVSQYRLKLLAAELIVSTKHGYVDFTLPYLRDYLRSHVASRTFGTGEGHGE